MLTALNVKHLDFRSDKVNVAWDYIESGDISGIDCITHIDVVYDALVERAVNLLEVNSKTTRSICLRIGVNHKYALFQCGKRRSQIDGCCCLAHASFLISERDYFTEFFVHDLIDMYILDCKDTIFFPNTRILSQIKYIFLHFND